MPSFDFHCAANGQTIEIMLKMHETLSTWGELCARKGIPLGETPADSPLEKVFTKSWVMDKKNMGSGHDTIDMSFTGQSRSYTNSGR